jgi:molybdopterin molybdotransferase
MVSHREARCKVIAVAAEHRVARATETLDLPEAAGRVLAEDVFADRDYPPFERSLRDGFALRSSDATELPRRLRVVGEVKAGASFAARVGTNECVQIMTGAAAPAGADAVVMIEHVRAEQNEIEIERAVRPGQNIVAAGSEAKAGQVVLTSGTHLGYAELAMAAQVGHARARVHARPRVAIISTGDEVVLFDQTPGPFEIRNSNNVSLAMQTTLAGGEPILLGNVPDEAEALRARIERGLEEDIVLLSGGVSMGKYDLVENVLKEMGAEFHFDAVAIRPGRPAVFGVCRNRLVFGLPGNPVSTMVTFELLVVPAIDILGGATARPLPLLKARLARAVDEKPGLTHIVPALLTWPEGEATVEMLPWQGSGDIVALAKANCFLVVHDTRLTMAAGEWVDVMPRRGVL